MAKKKTGPKSPKPTTGRNLRLARAGGKSPAGAEQAAARLEAERAKVRERFTIELDATDRDLLRHIVAHPTITQTELGQLVGLTRHAVAERMQKERFRRALHAEQMAPLEILRANQAAAARKLGEHLRSADERVSLRACIVHLWPLVRSDKDLDERDADFIGFIEQAYQEAQAAKAREGA